MDIQSALHDIKLFKNLDLLAKQVVEGISTGMHKSPFHGFSSEFAEHKIYNPGESTKHIDWKRFAKTDKLYTKHYEEETNLRCHVIIDNSSSMHYPQLKQQNLQQLNKIGFSVLASAALLNLLKKQRDTFGLSIYSDQYDYYAPEKGSERHYQMLLNVLNSVVVKSSEAKETKTHTYLHQIAEKIHRRSMILFFTDMFQTEVASEKLFNALRHLKHNKHEVVLFHVMDKTKELTFDFDNAPKRFIDVETGEHINLYPQTIQENYKKAVTDYFYQIKLKCLQYNINYVEVDTNNDLTKVLLTFLIERQKFS